jgi:DNA-binding transcriptional LysR family regulator
MTLQQLRYAIEVAETGTFGEAARKLYVSQPSLSFAIKELEGELNITIFTRSNKGTIVTDVGEKFLKGARQILMQVDLLEDDFAGKSTKQYRLSVSTQHYTFASLAFVELVNACEDVEYELILNETKTMDVIEDVKSLRSELGILYIGKDNEAVIRKLITGNQIEFTELFTTYPYILVGKHNPLAQLDRVRVDDLENLPCISFVQKDFDPYFFSEEIISIFKQKRSIKISDRGALSDLLFRTDAFVISTGLYLAISGDSKGVVAIPLDASDSDNTIHVGVIRHRNIVPTAMGELFCDMLKQTIKGHSLDEHIKRYY